MYQIEEQDINTGDSEWYDFDNLLALVNCWGNFKLLKNKTYSLHRRNPIDGEWVYIGQLEKEIKQDFISQALNEGDGTYKP